jgi:hypothetical protein
MAWVDYEEKSYENAANIELALGGAGREVWSPGQVGEAILGYDVAANLVPASTIWKLLKVMPPSGVSLNPSFWLRRPQQPPAVDLPATPVTLVLQYKRPQVLSTGNAKQWDHWGEQYFRIIVTDPPGQLETLLVIEEELKTLAVVRYAGPAIESSARLQEAQRKGQILDLSNFVPPSTIGADHEAWTYTEAGTDGHVNAEGRAIEHEDLTGFRRHHLGASRRNRGDSILQHLRKLAGALGVDALATATDAARGHLIEAFPQLVDRPERVQGLFDLFAVGQVLSLAEASWFMSAAAEA